MSIQFKTYAVPSWFQPQAFISRASLPSSFDLIFGNNARYPIELIAIDKNPFRSRRIVYKKAQNYIDNFHCQNESCGDENIDTDLATLMDKDKLERVLSGIDMMTPTIENQQFWAAKLSPDQPQCIVHANERDVWKVLLTLNQPLLLQFATDAQNSGMSILGLNQDEIPFHHDINARLKAASGWSIVVADHEVNGRTFFDLLANKQFPIVPKLRPLHAVLCGFEPDYWHDCIGHLALLSDPHYADFYQWCAQFVQSAKKDLVPSLYKIFWVILEYGILQNPQQGTRAFGGALGSSYMGLQRLKRGYITTKYLDPKLILESELGDSSSQKRKRGKIELFHVESLESAKSIILNWYEREAA